MEDFSKLISPTSVCYISSWQSPQNGLEKHKVWNKPFVCATKHAGTQSFFPVCVTVKPLPPISFPGVWLWTCTCILRPVQMLLAVLSWMLNSSATQQHVQKQCRPCLKICLFFTDLWWYTMESPGCPQIPLHSSRSVYTISHNVTTTNIDILLCRGM